MCFGVVPSQLSHCLIVPLSNVSSPKTGYEVRPIAITDVSAEVSEQVVLFIVQSKIVLTITPEQNTHRR